jgi:hypothetical protein
MEELGVSYPMKQAASRPWEFGAWSPRVFAVGDTRVDLLHAVEKRIKRHPLLSKHLDFDVHRWIRGPGSGQLKHRYRRNGEN